MSVVLQLMPELNLNIHMRSRSFELPNVASLSRPTKRSLSDDSEVAKKRSRTAPPSPFDKEIINQQSNQQASPKDQALSYKIVSSAANPMKPILKARSLSPSKKFVQLSSPDVSVPVQTSGPASEPTIAAGSVPGSVSGSTMGSPTDLQKPVLNSVQSPLNNVKLPSLSDALNRPISSITSSQKYRSDPIIPTVSLDYFDTYKPNDENWRYELLDKITKESKHFHLNQYNYLNKSSKSSKPEFDSKISSKIQHSTSPQGVKPLLHHTTSDFSVNKKKINFPYESNYTYLNQTYMTDVQKYPEYLELAQSLVNLSHPHPYSNTNPKTNPNSNSNSNSNSIPIASSNPPPPQKQQQRNQNATKASPLKVAHAQHPAHSISVAHSTSDAYQKENTPRTPIRSQASIFQDREILQPLEFKYQQNTTASSVPLLSGPSTSQIPNLLSCLTPTKQTTALTSASKTTSSSALPSLHQSLPGLLSEQGPPRMYTFSSEKIGQSHSSPLQPSHHHQSHNHNHNHSHNHNHLPSPPLLQTVPISTHKFIPISSPSIKSKSRSETLLKSPPRSYHLATRACISCGLDQSPCWRPSWSIKEGQLCNSCGLRYKKTAARCLNDKCRKIPAKGEWSLMQSKGQVSFEDGLSGYSCLDCGWRVEVK